MTRRVVLALALCLSACGTATPPPTDSAASAADAGGDGADTALSCPVDQCGQTCTDLRSDPDNCGACGRTCLVLQGEGACASGECVLNTCDDGWGDCDGDPANGCETASDCVERAPCVTECGSTGAVACADVCAPTCVLPVETCNAQDDDCDEACDEGALPGCRQSVYRSSGPLGHVYGLDASEAEALGQTVERDPYFYTYAAETEGLVPLYRCDKGGGRRFLTTSSACEIGVAPDLVVGWVSRSERCGAVPLYRLYSGAASNHFYTTSAAERDNAVAAYGYQYESVAGYVWAEP